MVCSCEYLTGLAAAAAGSRWDAPPSPGVGRWIVEMYLRPVLRESGLSLLFLFLCCSAARVVSFPGFLPSAGARSQWSVCAGMFSGDQNLKPLAPHTQICVLCMSPERGFEGCTCKSSVYYITWLWIWSRTRCSPYVVLINTSEGTVMHYKCAPEDIVVHTRTTELLKWNKVVFQQYLIIK